MKQSGNLANASTGPTLNLNASIASAISIFPRGRALLNGTSQSTFKTFEKKNAEH